MTRPPRIAREVPRGKRVSNTRLRPKHLEFIRALPCVTCGIRPTQCFASEAAHVRIGTDGGVALKPSDRYAVPLCRVCHDTQHAHGELTFWAHFGIDPLNVALRLWTISGDIEAGERIVFRARQAIGLRLS
jgi:hypothetical protein